MFRLNSAPVNLGYVTRDRGNPNAGDRDGLKSYLQDRASNSTWIYLMMTLDPALATAESNADKISSRGEAAKLLRHTEYWIKRIKKKNDRTAEAFLKVIGTDIDGGAVFIPRFIHSQAPPPEYDTPEKIARFVSMVPFLDDWNAFVDCDDLFCTSQEFLDICAGDWEEHAILLRNYLEHVDTRRQHYLVAGTGIPEGETFYVLSVDPNSARDHIIWNASTGEGFVTSNRNCPLKDVSLVMSADNIWANIQERGAPQEIRTRLLTQRTGRPSGHARSPRWS